LIKIVETPRDAFQGINTFIPTEKKTRIINLMLKAGFDTVEAGSFVSRKVIPQMADTAQVLRGIDKTGSQSRIMVLVVNKAGGMRAIRQGTPNCHPVKKNLESGTRNAEQIIIDENGTCTPASTRRKAPSWICWNFVINMESA